MTASAKQPTAPLRVLIISYHFPPLNVIASFRAEGFAKYLPDHGMEVTVLTMLWEKDAEGGIVWHQPETPITVTEEVNAKVIRIPRIRTLVQRFLDHGMRIPLLSQALTLGCHALGLFDLRLAYVHLAFKQYARKTFHKQDFDLVLASSIPEEHIGLGAWINKRYGIPFIADYRDLYDLRPLRPITKHSLRERLILRIKQFHHRRWTKQCELVVSVSKPLIDALAILNGSPQTLEVRNGYLPHKITKDEHAIRTDLFRLTYAGRIYPWQEVDPFIIAYRSFLDGLTPEEIKRVDLKFYGCQDLRKVERLKNGLQGTPLDIHITRIPEQLMYQHIAESSVLLVFDIGLKGGYTGKLMDYLGCHRNILMIPTDNGVMAELIHSSRIGAATSDPQKAATQLLAWFREWQTNGHPEFHGDERIIEQGSRAFQTGILADAIKEVVHEHRLSGKT